MAKLEAMEYLKKEYEKGNTEPLIQHENFHKFNDGAKISLCFFKNCPYRPVVNGTALLLSKEIASLSKKEFQILVDKDFLREFSERDRKIILGDIKLD